MVILSLLAYPKSHFSSNKAPMIGKKIPLFQLQTLSGKVFNNHDLKGKFSLIHFWATWCQACQIEHHSLLDLKLPKSVAFYGIAYRDSASSVKQWLQTYSSPYETVAIDHTGVVAMNFGITGVPELFIINEDSKIVYRHKGMVKGKQLIQILEDIMSSGA